MVAEQDVGNLNKVNRMSPSSISSLESCPRSWWRQRVEGVRSVEGSAGKFGKAFGRALQRTLGAAVNLASPDAANYMDPLDPEGLDAVNWYMKQPGAWQPKPGLLAEVPVVVTPDRWADLCRHLDLAPPVWRIPIVGYLDLVDPALRTGAGIAFLETKTSKRTEFRDYYAPQSYFYLAALGLADPADPPLHADLHLLVRLASGYKFGQWRLDASMENMRWMAERYNATLNYAHSLLSATVPPPLPARPGPTCAWCPDELTCHAPCAVRPRELGVD